MRPLLAALMLLTASARGEEYLAPGPPPPIYSKLLWTWSASSSMGYWYTADQVQRINAQLDYLTDRAARECVVQTSAADKAFLTSAPGLIAAGALLFVLGGATGWALARHF